jgi:predicted PurR-regulated permease PerM
MTPLSRWRVVAHILFGLPVAIAAVLDPRGAYSIILLVAFTAALVPGFEQLCTVLRCTKVPRLRYLLQSSLRRRTLAALLLGGAWTLLVLIGSYVLIPFILQGSSEALAGLQKFADTISKDFGDAWSTFGPLLEKIGISQGMFDKAVAWIRDHAQAIVAPGTLVLQWIASTFLKGTISVFMVVSLPYFIIFMLWDWKRESDFATSITHSLFPKEVARALIEWWNTFTVLSSKLFKALGIGMVAYTGIYIAALVVTHFLGYPMSIARAVFDGCILGVIAGVPVLGGIANLVVIAVIAVTSFGADGHILLALLALGGAVFKLEMGIVTPLLVGKHLEFSSIGLLVCFVAGFAMWGTSLLGIGTALLLLPYFKATKVTWDHMQAQK